MRRGWRVVLATPRHLATQRAADASLFRGKAIEEAVAPGALEIILAAAAVRPARGVRRIPRLRRIVVTQTLSIVMTDHRRALTALGPVAARPVLARREGGTIRLRARQDVVHVRCVATAVDDFSLLGQRRLLGHVVI